MSKLKTDEKWIEAAYEIFAQEGPLGIQVERLARKVAINKSGFYHYFRNHNTFISRLIDHHCDCMEHFVSAIFTLDDIDPGYLDLVIKSKVSVMVHMQLGRNRTNSLFSGVYADFNSKIASAISPIWAAYVNLPNNPELALRYFELVSSSFNAQVRFSDLNYGVLHAIVLNAKLIVDEIINRESSPDSISYRKT
jgi:AcrR family transcriptional regulator